MNKKTFIISASITFGVALLATLGFLLYANQDKIDMIIPDSEPSDIVPAPDVTGKIKGYWSSRGGMIKSELHDAEKLSI